MFTNLSNLVDTFFYLMPISDHYYVCSLKVSYFSRWDMFCGLKNGHFLPTLAEATVFRP